MCVRQVKARILLTDITTERQVLVFISGGFAGSRYDLDEL